MNKKKNICLLPRLEGYGGPASFQTRLKKGLALHGIEAHHDPDRNDYSSMLVIGGSHQFLDIYRAKQRGVRIVQRLDGMNWMHRVRKTGVLHYLRAEWYNRMLAFTRRYLANHIVYQSEFSRDWWNSTASIPLVTSQVTYNGVDLDLYNSAGEELPPKKIIRILVIETRFSGGYESGLENAIDFSLALQKKTKQPLELLIVGEASQSLRETTEVNAGGLIHWVGRVAREEIPALNRSAHMLFSADINAACPNSVIEALACGLPVIGYATGSLPELVGDEGGLTAPYGNDYWKLEPANPAKLVDRTLKIIDQQKKFRIEARKRAEKSFGVEDMTEQYLHALNL